MLVAPGATLAAMLGSAPASLMGLGQPGAAGLVAPRLVESATTTRGVLAPIPPPCLVETLARDDPTSTPSATTMTPLPVQVSNTSLVAFQDFDGREIFQDWSMADGPLGISGLRVLPRLVASPGRAGGGLAQILPRPTEDTAAVVLPLRAETADSTLRDVNCCYHILENIHFTMG